MLAMYQPHATDAQTKYTAGTLGVHPESIFSCPQPSPSILISLPCQQILRGATAELHTLLAAVS